MKTKTLEDIVNKLIKKPPKTRNDLDSFKRQISKEHKIPCPANVDLIRVYHKLVEKGRIKRNKSIEGLLRVRPVRSLSGIINVSVLTKPYPCPGQCIYCPTQKGIPKSYLKKEPAVTRAIALRFNPYKQVQVRLQSLQKTGHPIDKVELRIIGGTWSFYPKTFQQWFITECFRACNEFGKRLKIKDLILKRLEEQQRKNEKTKCKIVGITVETRPDYIDINEIKQMRRLGITRVELGVQSIYNDVLRLNKRGHKIEATINATRMLKDAGFKVCYQMMPNLPGSNFKKDVQMFEQLFSNPDFKPDLLKIYPLALVKEAPLYKWYQQGKYKPYDKEKLIKLLVEIKKTIPYYCRIQRIIRDIPSEDIIEGGIKVSNLREVVQKQMQAEGLKCKCIRCREVKNDYKPQEKLHLFKQRYRASCGEEIFLSFESIRNKNRKLYALLRLRIPSTCALPVLKNSAIIRELHTYGQMTPVGESISSTQHKGLGKKLIRIAESIAKKEFGLKKVAVIASIGTRNYYRRVGYKLKNTYMLKML